MVTVSVPEFTVIVAAPAPVNVTDWSNPLYVSNLSALVTAIPVNFFFSTETAIFVSMLKSAVVFPSSV